MTAPGKIKPKIPEREASQLPEGKGWWYVRFQINWSDDYPQWSIGTLLAGEIIAPILNNNRQDIELWRFHRRAAHDGYGHVFSFIFYSSAQTARKVNSAINKDALLSRLTREKNVIKVSFDDPEKITRPDIEDTSDPVWPESIQRTWPTFIMGASQMWLDLVIELAYKERKGQAEEILYVEVQNQITGLWMRNAKHAWMHHLNVLYAYQPILMRY
jgi:hypothetical protein